MDVRQSRRTTNTAACVCIALALGACGGGGGGGGDPPRVPTVTLSADPLTLTEGSKATLTWSSTDASSCTSSDGWSGQRSTSGGMLTDSLFATTTFSLSCSGPGGTSQTAAVTITVVPKPIVTLTLLPNIAREGTMSQLTWTAANVTSCRASDGWTGDRPANGTETVGPFTRDTPFTLTCTGDGGTAVASAYLSFRPGVNEPPRADAGPDQIVFSTDTVQLHAGSSDSYSVVSRVWTQTRGPVVTLSEPGFTLVAPIVASDTVITFSLVVTDDEGASSAPDTVDITVKPVPAQVTLHGQILYERVALDFRGLQYPDLSFVGLSAEVLIEALDADTQNVIDSGLFAGNYELTVPGATNIMLRATAETSRQAPAPLPHWHISVRDLDDSGAPLGPIHSYTSPAFGSGAGGVRDFEIPSGWTSDGALVGPRFAAPFAVLDSIQTGLDQVLNAVADADLPPLTIDWGPNNPGDATFYDRDPAARRIVLAGEVNVDTDEYDPPVILHEFGHYIDDTFSRSDSPGGPHSFGDRLDLRLAFGEGLATAFSSMARGTPEYRDSFGPGQADAGFFSLEVDSPTNEGWYSESSVQELLWDLFDAASDGNDTITAGFEPILGVLRGAHAQTDAMTSIFTFMTAYKQARPAEAAATDAMLSAEQIVGPTMDIYGSDESNDAGSGDVLPIYTSIALGGSTQVRSTVEFGPVNKLSSHRFLRFSLAAPTNVRFDVTSQAGRDPDIQVFRRGVPLAPDMGPADESFTLSLDAGEYVLDVYDCGNAGCNSGVTPGPADITVAVTPD